MRIKLKAYDPKLITQSAEHIVSTVRRSGDVVKGPVPIPTKRKLFTVLRSTHVYKTAREQFEMRTHQRLIDVPHPSQKTIDALMNLEVPNGVDIVIKMDGGIDENA